MHTFSHSIVFEGSQEDAWAVLSAVDRWPEWLPTVDRVDVLDQAAIALGRRYRVHQPRLRPALWRISQVEAPHGFAWESRTLGLVSLADHRLEEAAAGRLRLSLSIAMRGPLTPLVRRAYGDLIQDYLTQEAAALERRVKAEA